MENEQLEKFDNIEKLISNTPMIDITYLYNDKKCHIYAKCEWYSLTGSIKDKVAYQIIKDAYTNGKLKHGQKLVEVSSGNMGLSLCAIANLMGNPISIIMPKSMSEERKKLIKMYGGELIETDDFSSAFELCKKMVESDKYFCTQQFKNESNKKAHSLFTAKEILQHKNRILSAECFVSGVGTSGTLSGVGEVLKSNLGVKVVAIEPQNARVLTAKPPFGKHKLQGLSDEILPDLYNRNLVDDVFQITDDDAIAFAQKIAKELSIGVGISSGANLVGCVLSGKDAITILPDDNKKYLSTSLSKNITTPLIDKIKFVSFKTF